MRQYVATNVQVSLIHFKLELLLDYYTIYMYAFLYTVQVSVNTEPAHFAVDMPC